MLHLLSFYLSTFYWNPEKIAFTLPLIDVPIAWYGIFFSFGFFLGYLLCTHLLRTTLRSQPPFSLLPTESIKEFADRILFYIVIGTLVGARLGHVIFYDLDYFMHHPFQILMVRNGGLASHGGTLGVLLALYLFVKKMKKQLPSFSFISMIDLLCIPTALAVLWIRIGNFFNQEIVGIPTQVPWGVVFGQPMEAPEVVARHPTQLYEAMIYFFTFLILYASIRKKPQWIGKGIFSGFFFISLFTGRFFVEWFKEKQGSPLDSSFLQVGQLLSVPFILFGFWLLFQSFTNSKTMVANGGNSTSIQK